MILVLSLKSTQLIIFLKVVYKTLNDCYFEMEEVAFVIHNKKMIIIELFQ